MQPEKEDKKQKFHLVLLCLAGLGLTNLAFYLGDILDFIEQGLAIVVGGLIFVALVPFGKIGRYVGIGSGIGSGIVIAIYFNEIKKAVDEITPYMHLAGIIMLIIGIILIMKKQ